MRLVKRARRLTRRVLIRNMGLFGFDVFDDLRRRGVAVDPGVILDVGANNGWTAVAYAKRFPAARIFAFEPSRVNFAVLERVAARYASITCSQIALSSISGRISFVDDASNHTMSHLSDTAAGGYEVETLTLDAFCDRNGLDRIAYLKIDTEGHDLAVLQGAGAMLRAGRIAALEVECGVNPENDYHASLESMKSLLEEAGYRLFGFYEQVHEWPENKPNLRRVNAVFIVKP